MPTQINSPARVSRSRATALTTYFLLDTGPFEANPNRWAHDGVAFVPYGCATEVNAQSVDPCADDGEDFDYTPQGFPDYVEFPAFAFELGIQCSLLSMTGDDLRKQLDVLVESELSPIFGEQVMAGVWNSAAPSLVSEAVVYDATVFQTAIEAVAAVEDALADVWRDSVGMIHVSPGTLTLIVNELEFVDGRFETPAGNIVVADAGYQGVSPASGVDTAGEAWVYGSSPVHYRYLTPDYFGVDFENWITAHNDQVVRVAGIGIAVFEPCSVVAAQFEHPSS